MEQNELFSGTLQIWSDGAILPHQTNHLPKQMGVYMIKNLDKIYIGFSYNIRKRVSEHFRYLREFRYDNEMQNDWNINCRGFTSYLVELTTDPAREEYWILHYNSNITGYNKSIGRKHCELAKCKIHNSLLGNQRAKKEKNYAK